MRFPKKKVSQLEQLAFWLFIYLFIFDYHFVTENWGEALWKTLVEVSTYATVAYINHLLLIPLLLEKKQHLLYAVSIAGVVFGNIAFTRLSGLETYLYEYQGFRNICSIVLNTSLFLLVSSLYRYLKRWHEAREQQLILKGEKLEAELNFLRAQISPHFVFNTLNNIYALALQKHDNTAPMVAKLSALLRHLLYESNQTDVLLKKEIDTLKQYVELNLLRKPRSQNVDFYAEGNPSDWRIVPMLLINFVENAFKHSNLDHDENAWIKINSAIDELGDLHFITENSIPNYPLPAENGGIGLKNVRRQLELNYPETHQLITKMEDNTFVIQLTIQLQKV